MIGRLTGKLAQKSPEALIVDVHGVGFRVLVSLNAFSALPAAGETVTLETHMHVRENATELFGFLDAAEKRLFSALLAVAGVGPRMAINILSGMPTAALCEALAAGDVGRLTSVPGVGKKTAERLVVELKDQLAALQAPERRGEAGASDVERQAVSALVNLGYKRSEAERAARKAAEKVGGDLAEIIREALRRVSR